MEVQKQDRVINVRTGEFGVVLNWKEVVTVKEEKYLIYEVKLEGTVDSRAGWKPEEIAHWDKTTKMASGKISPSGVAIT
jgi:hypothetical protein